MCNSCLKVLHQSLLVSDTCRNCDKFTIIILGCCLKCIFLSLSLISIHSCNTCSCRATEWPFWIGMILPFLLVTIFNWIMFVLIMISICGHAQAPVTDKKERSKMKAMRTHFTIAATLAVVFGLGWALGLAATSLPVKELTLTFQILFSIFVGAQGVLLFLLHGVRNQDIRNIWIQCIFTFSRKSHLASVIFSTKTSSVGQGTLHTKNTSRMSTLPHKEECPSAIDSKQPGGSIAIEDNMDDDEENIYDDVY